MKILFAIAAAAIAMLLVATMQTRWIVHADAGSGASALAQNDALSASRKKVKRRTPVVVDSRSPYYLKPGVKLSFGYIGPPGYAGEYAWRKSIGQCVEDLGYGRWAACPSW